VRARADEQLTIRGVPTTVLVAPDAFKGTFDATQVATLIGHGLEAAGWPVELCPIADGGEGTLEVLTPALAAELHTVTARDPLGRPVGAQFGLSARTAIVEAASAIGLGLVAASDRDPLEASSYGAGELVAAAIAAGAHAVLLGVGGSATTDGGSGAIRAIRAGGGLRGARLVVLCDVRTPFEDAARVFGPQKGADADQVRRLTTRLHALARRLERDPRGVPMTGAAGGLAGGLWGALGAELAPGAPFVLDALRFDQHMRASRAVVTGEGRLDHQSLAGKALAEVATRARQAGVPSAAVVGSRALDRFEQRILDLQVVLEASTLEEVEAAGRTLGGLL
jgi:glycerate kinase